MKASQATRLALALALGVLSGCTIDRTPLSRGLPDASRDAYTVDAELDAAPLDSGVDARALVDAAPDAWLGEDAAVDANVGIDAPVDASVDLDAHVDPDAYSELDAHVEPDAYVEPDASGGPDAYLDLDAALSDAGCLPGTARCDGATLLRCTDGSLVPTPCDLGCLDDSLGARCARLAPTHVPAAPLDLSGLVPLVVGAADRVTLDTDNGEIRRYTGMVVESVRFPGAGLGSGIFVENVVQGAGAPEIASFAVASLQVAAGGRLEVIGARALVLLVQGDASIEGTIDAGARGATPGPGGYALGAGVGGDGDDTPVAESAGGGGGFGGGGGAGDGETFADGGRAGVTYGDAALTVLQGGSSGGRASGARGGGGGALQISAGGSIVVGASGVLTAPGGGGGPGRSGGGGGGAGGAIFLEAPRVSLGGVLTANGGGGGGGSEGISDATAGARGTSSTARAAGGSGPAGDGRGGQGAGGGSAGGSGGEGAFASGGGGGGGGRIRVLSASGAAVLGTVSPSALASRGTIALR